MISRFHLYTVLSIDFWYFSFATVLIKSLKDVKHWGDFNHSNTSTSTIVCFLHPSMVFLFHSFHAVMCTFIWQSMSSSSFKGMWFSSRLGYLHKIWVIHKRFPSVMLKTPTCIHSIKHPCTKSRDFHFPESLKIAQWCSLKSKTSLSSVYFPWNIAETTVKGSEKRKSASQNLFDHLQMVIHFLKFFKLAPSDDFTRFGSFCGQHIQPVLSDKTEIKF